MHDYYIRCYSHGLFPVIGERKAGYLVQCFAHNVHKYRACLISDIIAYPVILGMVTCRRVIYTDLGRLLRKLRVLS